MSHVEYRCATYETIGCPNRAFAPPGGTTIPCARHPEAGPMVQTERWDGDTYAFRDPGAFPDPPQKGTEIEQDVHKKPALGTLPPEDKLETQEEKLARIREEFKEVTGDYPDGRIKNTDRLQAALDEQRAIYQQNLEANDNLEPDNPSDEEE